MGRRRSPPSGSRSLFRASSRALRLPRLLAGASALAALLSPALVRAQASGALDRLDPAPAGDTFVSMPSADVAGKLRFAAAATFSYAHDPLVLRSIPSGTTLDWMTSQTLLHLQASVEVWRRLKLDVDVPLMLTEDGTSGTLGNITATPRNGTHFGDVRVEARAAVLHQEGWVPAAGVTLSVWAPSGSAPSFAGAGVVRVEPGVVIGAEFEHLVWGASAGARFQPAVGGAVTGSQIVGGLGVAARFYGVTLGPELSYGLALGDARADIFQSSAAANGELLARRALPARPRHLRPRRRPRPRARPRHAELPHRRRHLRHLRRPLSGTGARRRRGARPRLHGPARRAPAGAPGPRRHRRRRRARRRGRVPERRRRRDAGRLPPRLPPDRDRDGIPDVDDACPDVPGVPSPDPAKNGCPADTDGDGIPDDKDACPNEKGPPNADPKRNGCPTAVRVEGTQIVILQQVNFDTGKDTIDPSSFDLLGQVAAALEQHPDIARVAVDGHTDNVGGDKPNKSLSEHRALAVVRWLIDHGVDARRLEARGFGQRRPIADNRNEAGRAKNRRVEFLIRRRTDEGKDGWLDGSVTMGPQAAPNPGPAKPAHSDDASPPAPKAPGTKKK